MLFGPACPRREQAVDAILATEDGRKCASLPDAQGRVPAHLAAMCSRPDLVELLLPYSGLGPDVGLEEVMARGKVRVGRQWRHNVVGRRVLCSWCSVATKYVLFC